MRPASASVSVSVVLLTALVAAPAANGQGMLRRYVGDSPSDFFGRSVAGAGDVDGDGFADVIVGADGDDNAGTDSGSARVFSGRTGAVLHAFDGTSIGDFFGYSVAGAGDVDGDGRADLIVGAYGDDPGSLLDAGSAYVLSGASGALLFTFHGDGLEDRFGYSVAGAGDVDGDGHADLIVGAYTDDGGGLDSGAAQVFSGRDGSVLHSFFGDAPGDVLGFAVAGAGDVDDDGHADVIVGAPGDDRGGDRAGTAKLFSGRTGALLHRFDGVSVIELAGVSVAGAGDVDGDGHDDVIVGAVGADDAGPGFGAARVFSGRTGAVIHNLGGAAPDGLFGWSVAGAGDVDGDGHADLVVAAVLDTLGPPVAGVVRVFSGRSGALLAGFGGGTVAEGYGFSAAGAGDVDGDGFDDVVVGAAFDDFGGENTGAAHVLDLGFIGAPPRARIHGAPCAGSDGHLPRVGFRGRAALGESLSLRLRGALPQTLAVLNLGAPTQASLDAYGMVGCTLYARADGFVVGVSTDAVGMAVRAGLTVPVDPSLVGLSISAQWIVSDPQANAGGHSVSDAVRFTFGS